MTNKAKIKKLYKYYNEHETEYGFDFEEYESKIKKMGGTQIIFDGEQDLLEEMEKFLNTIGYEVITDPLLDSTSSGSVIVIKKGKK